jgi:hypothetical protein
MIMLESKPRFFGALAVLSVILLSLSSGAFVSAQYETQQTTEVVVGANGEFHADLTGVGKPNVYIDIVGAPGATGSVTTGTYSGNPEPGATIPENVELQHFLFISFNMNASEFVSANITIRYTDSDIAGITQPYTLYKLIGNAFIAQTSAIWDTPTKTVTLTVTSITDPLFALGSTTTATPIHTSSPQPTQSGPDSMTTILYALAVVTIMGIVIVLAIILTSHKTS